MDEGGGDDDTSAELLEHSEDEGELGVARQPLVDEDGSKNTEGGGGQDDEQETDTETNVVVALLSGAGRAGPGTRTLAAAVLGFTFAYTVLDTGVEVTVLVAATLGLAGLFFLFAASTVPR